MDGLAVELVNTERLRRGRSVDLIATPRELRSWLTERNLLGERARLSPAELSAWHALRAAARQVITARIEDSTPPGAAIDVINAAASAVPITTELTWHRWPTAERRAAAGTRAEQALATIAADAIDAVTGERATHLARCGSPDCARLIEREHGRQQWCSTACGDRVRAARYYARHHGQPRSSSQ